MAQNQKRTRAQVTTKYGTTAPKRKEGETLEEYGTRLAMASNKRLQRLNQYAQREHMHGIKNYAYKQAMRDIQSDTLSWGKPGAKTYSLKMPENEKALVSKINSMKKFLESPSSTLTGIKKIYQERANTVNERYGTNFTWEELANYYEKDVSDIIDSKYGASKTVVKALGAINRIGQKKNETDEEYKERIQGIISSNEKLADDDIVNKVAMKLLSDGYTPDKLFMK